MNLKQNLDKKVYDCIKKYADLYCDEPRELFAYIENFCKYPLINKDAQEFYNVLHKYEQNNSNVLISQEDLSEKVKDELLGVNVFFDTISDVNNYRIRIEILDFNDFIEEYILSQYDESGVDIYEFWEEYGGKTEQQIIEEFIDGCNDVKINSLDQLVYIDKDIE